MKKYCFALDLKNDKKLIEEYREAHRNVWPEIEDSIKEAGIIDLEIYNVGDRMFMIMTVDDSFTFERKKRIDDNNAVVQKWEDYMWNYQKALPFANKGEKWVLMDKIYQL